MRQSRGQFKADVIHLLYIKQTEGVVRAAHVSISSMTRDGAATVKTHGEAGEGAGKNHGMKSRVKVPPGIRQKPAGARLRFYITTSCLKAGSLTLKTRTL